MVDKPTCCGGKIVTSFSTMTSRTEVYLCCRCGKELGVKKDDTIYKTRYRKSEKDLRRAIDGNTF